MSEYSPRNGLCRTSLNMEGPWPIASPLMPDTIKENPDTKALCRAAPYKTIFLGIA